MTNREKIQHENFKLPLFPTTTIGSFPQTKEVRANRAAYKKGTITREQYVEFNQKKITECIKLQKEKLWVNPDCGLKTRGEEETVASLKNLVAAAKELRTRASAI